MTDERYQFVEESLTEEEIKEGWHFCMEFDGLLVQSDPSKDICGKECIDWCRGKTK